jgi:hypothetical protein
MSDEPRFPPPHGEEPIGYRDAGAPVEEDKPEPPVPSSGHPPVHRGKVVVASRPDDPDVAIAKTYTTPRRTPTQQAGLGASIFLILFVLLYVYLQMASCHH